MQMINEKRRESLPVWDFIVYSFGKDDLRKFEIFFFRTVMLRAERHLAVHERLALMAFLVNVFHSLENDAVRNCALRLISLGLWQNVSSSRVDLELQRCPALKKPLARIRKEAASSAGGPPSPAQQLGTKRKRPADEEDTTPSFCFPDESTLGALIKRLERTLFPSLLSEFLVILESLPETAPSEPASAQSDREDVRYCEAFLSWIVDLLVQLPTRRFLMLLLSDCHFLQRCEQSGLSARARALGAQVTHSIYSTTMEAARIMETAGQPVKSTIEDTSAGARSSAGILGGSVLPAAAALTAAPKTALRADSIQADRSHPQRHGRAGSGKLFSQLLDMLRFYLHFEIEEHSGVPLTQAEADSVHAAKVGTLQRVCFKLFGAAVPEMKEFALAATAVASNPRTLRSYLGVLSEAQLMGLARNLRLLSPAVETLEQNQPTTAAERAAALQRAVHSATSDDARIPLPRLTRPFVTQVLVHAYEKRLSAVNATNALPLLPPESLLWDANLVPAGNRYTTETSAALALPKSGLQYLSLYDYLSRHFHLLRLESAYGVRLDLVDAIRRMGARLSVTTVRGGYPSAATTFTGWARMANTVDACSVVQVGQPRLGYETPSHVEAEVRYNLSKLPGQARKEWDSLREHDVLFLVTLQPIVPLGRHPDELRDPRVLQEFLQAATQGPSSLAALAGAPSQQQQGGKQGGKARRVEIPDEEDFTFPLRYGVSCVRGCEIVDIVDEQGDAWGEATGSGQRAAAQEERDKPRKMFPTGSRRTLRVRLDPAQYYMDVQDARVKEANDESAKQSAGGAGKGQAGAPGAQVPTAPTMPIPPLYSSMNLIVRRDPRSNNFRAVLETVRDLMGVVTEAPDTASGVSAATGAVVAGGGSAILPQWLQDIFLGYGDPAAAHYRSLPVEKQANDVDMRDTFLSSQHLIEAFPGKVVTFKDEATGHDVSPSDAQPPFRLLFQQDGSKESVVAMGYRSPPPGPYPEDQARPNTVRFTPTQVEAIRSGLNMGLTLIVGPPGTGKTDTAVQIVSNLYHAYPKQRILLVAHSNQALNDLFVKILARDISPQHLLRLGQGERELGELTDADFSKAGRIAAALERRLTCLREVERLGVTMGVPGDVGYTCETAGYFHLHHIVAKIVGFRQQFKVPAPPAEFLPSSLLPGAAAAMGISQADHTAAAAAAATAAAISSTAGRTPAQAAAARQAYHEALTAALKDVDPASIAAAFPFPHYFATAPGGLSALFCQTDAAQDVQAVEACFLHLEKLFDEVSSYRPLEILRSQRSRLDYLLQHQARIVACTVTHATIHRKRLVELGFRYDTVVMEEAGQVSEIESLIPLVCQAPGGSREDDDITRLKRVVLIGDHNQLPPIVQNQALAGYAHLDQSLFARLIRLGVPAVQLDMQGRARPTIADLYSWRYAPNSAPGAAGLGNLPLVSTGPEYVHANGGMAHSVQLIDVAEFEGRGEYCPAPHFYQNLGEAEYMVATYQYLRLAGWRSDQIAMLTTYNGQKALLRDIVAKRCSPFSALFGEPKAIETVDRFQGQQADIILLSLVRTKAVGHIRDVRRLVVALSRARLGLYIFAHAALFSPVHELAPAFTRLLKGCTQAAPLQLLVGESHPTSRKESDDPSAWARHTGGSVQLVAVEGGVLQMGAIVGKRVAAVQAHGSQAPPATSQAKVLAQEERETEGSSSRAEGSEVIGGAGPEPEGAEDDE